ncbi:MAG TPA: site-specific integrase [Nitrosopumilaceae archaeon]|nr:site-specific integrase [Nitrosopumilaceae archaeon]
MNSRRNEQNFSPLSSDQHRIGVKEKAGGIDWHNSKRRAELAKMRIQKRFSKENTAIAWRFLDRLRLDNMSYGRIENYSGSVIRVLHLKDDKEIKDWSKEEIEKVHMMIADSSYENSVKKDTLTALKRFYHFAVHNEIVVKSKNQEYDPNVAWITPGSFRDKFEKIQPRDLLTDEEILQLIQAVKKIGGKYVKRNIALIFVLLEGAYRPGELLNIRMGGIEFHKDFVQIHTTGKTGPKSLTLVASYNPLREWLNEHPKDGSPLAFLLYHDNESEVMRYWALDNLIKKAREKAGITKRVWPYLFRHTALTEYSKKLGNIAKIYGNWSKDSDMLSHYEHLASSDQQDAVLKLHGLKKDDEQNSILFSKVCPDCKQQNSSDKSHCIRCGMGLSKELAQVRQAMLEKRQNSDVKTLERKFSKKIRNLESLIIEQRRFIQQLVDDKTTK